MEFDIFLISPNVQFDLYIPCIWYSKYPTMHHEKQCTIDDHPANVHYNAIIKMYASIKFSIYNSLNTQDGSLNVCDFGYSCTLQVIHYTCIIKL